MGKNSVFKLVGMSLLCMFFTFLSVISLSVRAEAAALAPPPVYGVIVIGDSRTEYADYYAVKMPNEFYVYGYGMGYDWMNLVGIPQAEAVIAAHPEYAGWKIVSYMGYNDTERIQEYIAAYQNLLATSWAGYEVYFMSLAAVSDTNLYNTNLRNGVAPENMHNNWNADVAAFNQQLYASFPDRYIDIYTPMLNAGFLPEDGIHYANADANNYLLALMRLGIANQAYDRKFNENGELK